MFAHVVQGDNVTPERNFETFSAALLLLFQQLTGDGWSGVMDDLMITPARGCDREARPNAWAPPGDCGSLVALPYCVSFQLTLTLTLTLTRWRSLTSSPSRSSAGWYITSVTQPEPEPEP